MKRIRGVPRVIIALAASSLVSFGLYVVGTIYYGSSIFWFLNWNLILAWLPLLFAIWLVDWLKTKPWLSWPATLLTLLWLGFLPNSFYLISDFMHLNNILTSNPIYFAVLIFSFSFNGLMLGFLSLYLVHKELNKRLKNIQVFSIVSAVLLICSFAIYLGRYLRWSTWDVILNPFGVIFDVSDRIINPLTYNQTFQVTALFFVLLLSMYVVIWELAKAAREQ